MTPTHVRKAVFPVAGLGTRFLPATKASPKEMLPVVDKPLIQYAVEEAYAAGVRHMIFVTGRSKRAIEDHFDTAYELESELEAAIIDKLEHFLLELGKGFLFEARQKRFSFEEDHFYVDLVFYNRLLRCYVLIDLKLDKLTHQDLGQMQMYVNFFDRHVKTEGENPTIGIVLCKRKKDALIELTLPKNANIFASQYQLYLPSKKELRQQLEDAILPLAHNGLES